MKRILTALILILSTVAIGVAAHPHFVASESATQLNSLLQPGFGQAIVAVNNAEAAGATSTETAPLVALLNKALELNRQASSLPTNQTDQRNALLSNVNQILTNVTNQANSLTPRSAQRTYTDKIITYITGLVVAIVGTFAYVIGVEFYQRYRIKRTFQMRVTPK
jgi:predicted PurR-regulated permease PerM